MGDSTEEMLNVTIKRLEAIMVHFTPEEALEAEAHNLIDAAIVILKSSREDMDAGKAAAYWEKLRGYAKTLYIESVTMHYTKPRAGEFHLSNKLMTMICLCKMEKERIEEMEKNEKEEADMAAVEMKDKKKEMIEKTAQEFQKLNGDNQMFILGYMLGIQQERQRTTPQPQTA